MTVRITKVVSCGTGGGSHPAGPTRSVMLRKVVAKDAKPQRHGAHRDDGRPQGAKFPRDLRIVSRKTGEELGLLEGFFREAFSTVSCMLEAFSKGSSVDASALIRLAGVIQSRVTLEGNELLMYVLAPYREDTLARHSLNVAILSVMMGDELGMEKQELANLGLAALLADAAMSSRQDIVSKPGRLTEEEFEDIKKHPVEARKLLASLAGIDLHEILPAIEQHHERYLGQGYPKGIKGRALDRMASIIALADTYEALTHGRPHRDGLLPHKAIREVTACANSHFCPEVSRALLARLAVYPPGSYVELATGQIARVHAVNREKPLRPVVDVVLDRTGKRPRHHERIDLGRTTNCYILRAVAEPAGSINRAPTRPGE